jgi:hypothetical protein
MNGKTGAGRQERTGSRVPDEGENEMNTKLKAVCLGSLLALPSFLSQPLKADEWNKRTEFQFSEAVQIPGMVLAPGKYVFELADTQADRNIVQVFSEHPDGKETLVATRMAIPAYTAETPDKPVVNWRHRHVLSRKGECPVRAAIRAQPLGVALNFPSQADFR